MKPVVVHQKPFKCPHCETRFKITKSISRHIELKHSESPSMFQCWFCTKLYQNKANYNVHWNKTHKYEYLLHLHPIKVPVVGKKMKWHIYIHVHSFSFMCLLFFNKIFEVVPPVEDLSTLSINPITNVVADVKHNPIMQCTYGNPYNKPPFPISTLKRTQMVNYIKNILAL